VFGYDSNVSEDPSSGISTQKTSTKVNAWHSAFLFEPVHLTTYPLTVILWQLLTIFSLKDPGEILKKVSY